MLEIGAEMGLMMMPTLEPAIGRGDRKGEIAFVSHAVKCRPLSDLADQIEKVTRGHARPGNEVAPENGESPATAWAAVAIGVKNKTS